MSLVNLGEVDSIELLTGETKLRIFFSLDIIGLQLVGRKIFKTKEEGWNVFG